MFVIPSEFSDAFGGIAKSLGSGAPAAAKPSSQENEHGPIARVPPPPPEQ